MFAKDDSESARRIHRRPSKMRNGRVVVFSAGFPPPARQNCSVFMNKITSGHGPCLVQERISKTFIKTRNDSL